MFKILKADKNHIDAIIELAHETWHATYSTIISEEQINFMLNLFYTKTNIEKQITDVKHSFLVALENNTLVGYSHCFKKNNHYYISKLYVHPTMQGKGVGQLLMNEIVKEAQHLNFNTIELNVNRNNIAKNFYLKNNFKIIDEVDIPLDKYWLNDYIMIKEIV